MQASPALKLHALNNPGFRAVLLTVAGLPIVAAYTWRAIAEPVAFGTYLSDLQESYLRAAGRIASGSDPYDLCKTMGCLEPTGPQYVTPPLVAWMAQPLLGLDGHLVSAIVAITLNLSLAVFLFCALRALSVTDRHLAILLILMALAFEPVIGNIDEGQVNLVLLGLSGIWLWAWVDGRPWGGAALGSAIALKLIQGPIALLVFWRRRWSMLLVAAATGTTLWLMAVPQYLFEYLTKVLPEISQGTGFYENHSPGGTVARLFDPSTFLGATRGSPEAARAITLIIAVSAIVITLWALRGPSSSRMGRALEAAVVVSLGPIVASYSWGTHLVLLLLPMFVIVVWGIQRRAWASIALIAAGWLFIGPVHKGLQVLLVSGYSNLFVLRVITEMSMLGVLAVWIACLISLRRDRRRPSVDQADTT
jgi:hypothetical protein